MSDLISREALKKALHNFFDGKVIDEPAYILRDVFCHIDNAPTVEVKPECESCDYRKFTKRFIDGLVDVMKKNGISSVEELNRRLKGEES